MPKIRTKSNIDIVEIGDCAAKLNMLCDNLFFIRLGLRSEECYPNPAVTDNAIFVVEEEIRRIAQNIDCLLHEREEVQAMDKRQSIDEMMESN